MGSLFRQYVAFAFVIIISQVVIHKALPHVHEVGQHSSHESHIESHHHHDENSENLLSSLFQHPAHANHSHQFTPFKSENYYHVPITSGVETQPFPAKKYRLIFKSEQIGKNPQENEDSHQHFLLESESHRGPPSI